MKKTVNKLLWILFSCLCLVYIVWRLGWTIPTDHGALAVTFSLVLLLTELLGILEMFVHFYTLSGEEKQPPTPKLGKGQLPDVDVFVPTRGEPVELLERTLTGCLSMAYDDPGKVHIYLCDDADSPEMEALAARLGVGYLTRQEHTGAKAGNLNAALSRTGSPLIAVFDADMCPKPEFLLETVPCFMSEPGKRGSSRISGKVGYIQTPQQFGNADLFQRVFRAEEYIPNEQDYFYRSLEPARNKTNSVIFGGSNTVLLRAALEKVGGFCTESLTEDFATGILIQQQGYTCYAIAKPLAEGLSPESLPGLIRQRIRWARGCIQAGRCTRFLRNPGLNFIQRLSYLTSITYWYAPLKRLVYLMSPLLYAVFGVTVMRCSFEQMLVFWMPMYICAVLGIRLMSDGIRTAKWTNIYETCLFPFLLVPVLAETIGIKKKEFQVTDKSGRRDWKWWYPLPFVVLVLLSLVGIWRVAAMMITRQTTVYLLLLFWLVYDLYQLLFALRFVLGCRDIPDDKGASRLAHDLKNDGFGKTSLLAIYFRTLSNTRKE